MYGQTFLLKLMDGKPFTKINVWQTFLLKLMYGKPFTKINVWKTFY